MLDNRATIYAQILRTRGTLMRLLGLFQQAGTLLRKFFSVSKLPEKQLLYDQPLISLISVWNIISSLDVKQFLKKREAHE